MPISLSATNQCKHNSQQHSTTFHSTLSIHWSLSNHTVLGMTIFPVIVVFCVYIARDNYRPIRLSPGPESTSLLIQCSIDSVLFSATRQRNSSSATINLSQWLITQSVQKTPEISLRASHGGKLAINLLWDGAFGPRRCHQSRWPCRIGRLRRSEIKWSRVF